MKRPHFPMFDWFRKIIQILAGAATVGIFFVTWHSLNLSYEKSTEASMHTARQLSLMEMGFFASHRPFLGIEGFILPFPNGATAKESGSFSLRLNIKNYGTVPATEVTALFYDPAGTTRRLLDSTQGNLIMPGQAYESKAIFSGQQLIEAILAHQNPRMILELRYKGAYSKSSDSPFRYTYEFSLGLDRDGSIVPFPQKTFAD